MSRWESGRRGASEREADAPAAYQSALRSLAAREMSALQVTRTLRRKGHPAPVVAEVVDRLRSEGWVDDLRFACAFLRHRKRAKPSSVHLLRVELRRRGCDPLIADEAIARVGEEEPLGDLALARAAVARRRGADARNPDRLLRFLAGRGFSFEVARQAVAEVGLEPASPFEDAVRGDPEDPGEDAGDPGENAGDPGEGPFRGDPP